MLGRISELKAFSKQVTKCTTRQFRDLDTDVNYFRYRFWFRIIDYRIEDQSNKLLIRRNAVTLQRSIYQ